MRFLSLCFATSLIAAAAYAQDATSNGATGANWPSYGGTDLSWRYSALDQINTGNVSRLKPAWIFQTGDYGEGLLATPIVVDGVMYIITPHIQVFALDAATGNLIWHYKYPTPRSGRPGGMTFVQNRGVAVSDGKVLFGTTDNYVVALDQKTGQEIWKVSVDDPRQCGCDITAAPLVVKDKVIVGGTGGDAAHRGYLTAFYVKTGRLAWRWYVIPGPGEKGHETWKGDSWKFGGGAPWMTGSYDPELNLVYWGTGNAGGDFNDTDRLPAGAKGKAANLYTSSIVALDAGTGKMRWYYQEVPDDVWDFDAAHEVVLIDREIRGQMRKLLVHINKGGLMFVLDRVTGEYLGAFKVPELLNWVSGITEDGKLVGRHEPEPGKLTYVCPSSALGAKGWNSMAYSPRTGYIYIPTVELCNDLSSERTEPQEGRFYANGRFAVKLPPNRNDFSHLDAWDPVTRTRVWSMPYKYVLLASVLTTASDLVFTGDPEGNFFALNARTGEKLWSYQTGAGNRGGPVAYAVNGREYIATPTGWQQSIGGSFVSALFPDQTFRGGSALVVFSLPEESK